MNNITILYLYAELMGYQVPVLQEYVNTYKATVHVVHWDKKKLTPYIPPQINNVTYHLRSEHTVKSLNKLARSINPSIVYVSGWQDLAYLSVVKKLRRAGVPVVTGFDDQWFGTLRQYLASVLFPLLRKRYYSHAWVAGPYQFEYARRLGFRKNEIIHNLLTCNQKLFSLGATFLPEKRIQYPKRFMYTGRFVHVKGIDILVDAFKIYRNELGGRWDLYCAGNGEMRHVLDAVPGITVLDFLSQEQLVELTKSAGAFILPSRREPWGVVVHEFACAGLPLILSENVGASPCFLVENYNGYQFTSGDPHELARVMKILSDNSDKALLKMGVNSALLGARITPTISAASLVSLIKRLDK